MVNNANWPGKCIEADGDGAPPFQFLRNRLEVLHCVSSGQPDTAQADGAQASDPDWGPLREPGTQQHDPEIIYSVRESGDRRWSLPNSQAL
eukprot:scaffold114845_cov47-Prasinocladus_malaysianus.AAC.4